ncbi:hypothetical protein DIPPA_04333 [Diplonema papillatum]|nr:hypothetical protein DIPPA_04333 [Diplonema papillatum]
MNVAQGFFSDRTAHDAAFNDVAVVWMANLLFDKGATVYPGLCMFNPGTVIFAMAGTLTQELEQHWFDFTSPDDCGWTYDLDSPWVMGRFLLLLRNDRHYSPPDKFVDRSNFTGLSEIVHWRSSGKQTANARGYWVTPQTTRQGDEVKRTAGDTSERHQGGPLAVRHPSPRRLLALGEGILEGAGRPPWRAGAGPSVLLRDASPHHGVEPDGR